MWILAHGAKSCSKCHLEFEMKAKHSRGTAGRSAGVIQDAGDSICMCAGCAKVLRVYRWISDPTGRVLYIPVHEVCHAYVLPSRSGRESSSPCILAVLRAMPPVASQTARLLQKRPCCDVYEHFLRLDMLLPT